MMIGACSPASADSARFSAMYGYGSNCLWCSTRAMSRVLITIHVAISPRNTKMNGHDPPKRATLSATRSPNVRLSCAFLTIGCDGSWLRDHGYHELGSLRGGTPVS